MKYVAIILIAIYVLGYLVVLGHYFAVVIDELLGEDPHEQRDDTDS